MSGPAEEDVFQRLQPPPQEATDRLAYLATEQIIPAAEREQFGSFVQSLYEYGVLAGQCFASAQGGPFASPTIEACVKRLRSMGVYGVGQTSWGPTIFAAAENAIEAEVLCAACHADPFWQDAEFTIASADNAGATIDVGWL